MKSFIVSGVRTARSGSKAAIYRHLNIVNIIAYEQESDKLARIKEISLQYHYKLINTDVILSSMAIFMLEVCRNAIREKEANTELYDFIAQWLEHMDARTHSHPCLHLLFMIELSHHLGFGPMTNINDRDTYFDMLEGMFCEYHGGSEYIMDLEDSKVFYKLSQTDREHISQLQLTKMQRNSLADQLIKYYKLHNSGFKDLNSLEVLRNVL